MEYYDVKIKLKDGSTINDTVEVESRAEVKAKAEVLMVGGVWKQRGMRVEQLYHPSQIDSIKISEVY